MRQEYVLGGFGTFIVRGIHKIVVIKGNIKWIFTLLNEGTTRMYFIVCIVCKVVARSRPCSMVGLYHGLYHK